MGLEPRDESDVIGFEFIDIWANLFSAAVFPCWKRVADEAAQLGPAIGVRPRLEKTIALASVFHEIGHRVGPFKVSPRIDPGLSISTFHLDVLGELATDSLLVVMLEEFPELLQFVVLQRLFWFPRRGFMDSPESAGVNEDNDSWIGAFLFQRLQSLGAIGENDGRLQMNWSKARSTFVEILGDLDRLGAEILGRSANEQNRIVGAWMREFVATDSSGRFVLPDGLRRVFERCVEIPEVPHFQPMLSKGARL